MQKYYHLVKRLLEHFENYKLIHVDRENNDRANALAFLGSTKKSGQHITLIQETKHQAQTLLKSYLIKSFEVFRCLQYGPTSSTIFYLQKKWK